MSSLQGLLNKAAAASETLAKKIRPDILDDGRQENVVTDAEKLEDIRSAYGALQDLTTELKPIVDNFFNTLVNDPQPPSWDEASLRAMNAKLKVLSAFCPGICEAWLLEKDTKKTSDS